jgi:hypothetical protein
MRARTIASIAILSVACSRNSASDAGIDATLVDDTASDVAPDASDASDVVPLERVPRQIAPLSTSTVTSQRPTFHFVLSADADHPRVEICITRACDAIEQTIDATGTTGAPANALAPGAHFWRIHDGTRTTPSWSFYVRHRNASVDTSSGTVPDVNGDGLADILVGANHGEGQLGRVDVFHGTRSGASTAPQAQLRGTEPNGHFGWSVASAGDINGDGFGDVIVGAADAVGLSGRAYVFLGSASGIVTTASATLAPPDPMGNFGTVVAGVGDANGDGYADVAVGAPNANTTAGRTYVYLGGPSGVGTNAARVLDGPGGIGGAFGYSIAGAGDVNGDGLADLIVGADNAAMSNGEAYLYFGTPGGILPRPSVTLTSPAGPNGEFGAFVGAAGDVNGDGYADIIVSATATDLGNAYVYYGRSGGVTTQPSAMFSGLDGFMGGFGWSVSSAGDVNGDGFDDVVSAAICAIFGADPDGGYPHCGTGRVYLYVGSSGGVVTTPSLTLVGPALEGAFGWSAGAAGDVDGDGFGDMVVSAYALNMFAGSVFVYRGAASGPSSTPWITLSGATGTSDNYGWSVAFVQRVSRRPPG